MLRITGGTLRGLKLIAPKGSLTRPTSDLVKEAIFNIINPYVKEGLCLDLYAGSGALGIESYSRYELSAYLVDKSFAAIKSIRDNISKTHHEDRFQIIKNDAQKALVDFQKDRLVFSLVFLDPPYRYQNQNQDLERLFDLSLIKKGSIIVCQGDLELNELVDERFELLRFKKYGQTTIYIYMVN